MIDGGNFFTFELQKARHFGDREKLALVLLKGDHFPFVSANPRYRDPRRQVNQCSPDRMCIGIERRLSATLQNKVR